MAGASQSVPDEANNVIATIHGGWFNLATIEKCACGACGKGDIPVCAVLDGLAERLALGTDVAVWIELLTRSGSTRGIGGADLVLIRAHEKVSHCVVWDRGVRAIIFAGVHRTIVIGWIETCYVVARLIKSAVRAGDSE